MKQVSSVKSQRQKERKKIQLHSRGIYIAASLVHDRRASPGHIQFRKDSTSCISTFAGLMLMVVRSHHLLANLQSQTNHGRLRTTL